MFNIVCKTDPISGKDLFNVAGLPYIPHSANETSLTVYFASENNRQVYLETPVEHSTSELSVWTISPGAKLDALQRGPSRLPARASSRDGASIILPTKWSMKISWTFG